MAAMAENCAFNFSELEHVRYMLSPVRLSVVRITFVRPILMRFKFSVIFLRR